MKLSEDSLSEDLAYGPSGGRSKQWIAGVLLASLLVFLPSFFYALYLAFL